MIAINALATRAGGAAVRVSEVARRAPALWGARILLLRNEGVGIEVEPGPARLVSGWPRPLAASPALPRRVFEAAVVRRRCRGLPIRALLHYGTYVPLRPPADVLNVLCFISLAPWDPGPAAGRPRNRLLRALFERSRARVDLVVVQSQATRDFLAQRYPDIAGRLAVVINGLAVPALVRPAHPRGFLLLGDVHEYRRIDDVIRAYARLDPALRAAHPLTIAGHAGRDPAALRRIDEAVHTHGLSGLVRRPGLVSRARALELMAEAAAFVSYATIENGPNALREARAAGTPLILSDLAVHREFGGAQATYVGNGAALAQALGEAAAAADARSVAEPRAAVDTWDEHVGRLGALLAAHGVIVGIERPGRSLEPDVPAR